MSWHTFVTVRGSAFITILCLLQKGKAMIEFWATDGMVALNIPFFHPGSEHESVHWGSGSANTEGSEICGNNGNSAQEPWKQVQRGGKRPREQRGQAVQGNTHVPLSHFHNSHWLSRLLQQTSLAPMPLVHWPLMRSSKIYFSSNLLNCYFKLLQFKPTYCNESV